jgi:hypothetical protein
VSAMLWVSSDGTSTTKIQLANPEPSLTNQAYLDVLQLLAAAPNMLLHQGCPGPCCDWCPEVWLGHVGCLA